MNKDANYTWKLGLFAFLGVFLLMIAIYVIGENQNLFGSTFRLKTNFKNVSGLTEGNNVRFSGIVVGTVKQIEFVSDSLVVVNMVIEDNVQKYIKKDALASIGSDGLMGDKVLTIIPGKNSNRQVEDGDAIASAPTVEMEELMKGLGKTIDNAEIITKELSQFTQKINRLTDEEFTQNVEGTMNNLKTFTANMNNKNGLLSKLTNDERLAKSFDSTMTNIQTGTKKINEIGDAAKNNFLLRGYFKKKEKAEAKKAKDSLEKLEKSR